MLGPWKKKEAGRACNSNQNKPLQAAGNPLVSTGRWRGGLRERAPAPPAYRLPPPSPRTGRPAALGRPPARDLRRNDKRRPQRFPFSCMWMAQQRHTCRYPRVRGVVPVVGYNMEVPNARPCRRPGIADFLSADWPRPHEHPATKPVEPTAPYCSHWGSEGNRTTQSLRSWLTQPPHTHLHFVAHGSATHARARGRGPVALVRMLRTYAVTIRTPRQRIAPSAAGAEVAIAARAAVQLCRQHVFRGSL
jgi:hypothetical protein